VTQPIGIAHYPLHANTVEELMRLADGALYRAKHADKDQVQERCAEFSDLKDMPTQLLIHARLVKPDRQN